jgi:hypothetical protein
MPNQTTIELGVGLPTFVPLGKQGNIASYRENAVSVAVEPLLTISSQRPSKTSKLFKVRLKGIIPVGGVDAASQPTGVKIRENSFDISFMMHESATEAEKQYLHAVAEATISNTLTSALVTQGDVIY